MTDSFTFGQGVNVEDTFDSILESMVNESGEEFYVINTGVGGWGTLQETTYAQDHFELFKPDIIVLTFVGNDPLDDVNFRHGMRDQEKGATFYFPGKIFIRNHSHLYRLVSSKLAIVVHNWVLKNKIAEADQQNGKVQLDKQSASIVTDSDWEATYGYIRGFHQDFLAFNPDGVLLLQASAPWQADIRERLNAMANGETLIYVDLYDDTSQLTPEKRGMPHDGHWSPKMHAISAKNLFETIQALGKN